MINFYKNMAIPITATELIEKGQKLYSSAKITKVDIDIVITPLLDTLKGKKIFYMHRYMIKSGIFIGYKREQLHIRDGLYRRRILLKNVYIYDEVILSLLSLYQ